VRPVITEAARKLTRDLELGGYRIPAGTMPARAARAQQPSLAPEPRVHCSQAARW